MSRMFNSSNHIADSSHEGQGTLGMVALRGVLTTSAKISKCTGLLLLIGGAGSIRIAYAQSTHETGHQEDHHYDLGPDSGCDWLTPWAHSHYSERGTPYVHVFNIEPAFLGRELFLSYGSARGSEGDEAEFEMELEWAFTRRIGMVLEAPLIQLDPSGANSESGLGDIATAARALLVESADFLLAGNLELSIPTGDEDLGLGNGEASWAPSFSAWFDLRNRLQASVQIGAESGMDSGDSEFFYNAALVYILQTHDVHPETVPDRGHKGAHSLLGVTSGILEFNGRTSLDSPSNGHSSAELLIGAAYNMTSSVEVRGAFQFPVGGHQEHDSSFTLGLVYHF